MRWLELPSGSAWLFALLLSLQFGSLGSSASHYRHFGSAKRLNAAEGTCAQHSHTDPIPGYTWFTTDSVRKRAQVSMGSQARLRAAMDRYTKLQPGENLTVVFLGGSITAGQGALDGYPFPTWAERSLHASMGKNVRIHNGAVPGTLSSYMSVCHNIHVPRDADIIILDYAINDDSTTMPVMDNAVRRPFERLIRKLLNYPRRPAVILIHAYAWHRIPEMGPSGMYYPTSERDFHEFAMYYDLPELSVKAAAWKLMNKGVNGYLVHRTRADRQGYYEPELDSKLKGTVFYWDIIHPDGQTGHKFMGEIVVQALLDALVGVKAKALTAEEQAELAEETPPPMLSNNWQPSSDKCMIGPALVASALESVDWEYTDEGKHKARAKLGYVSTKPGAVLKLKINTTSSTGSKDLPVLVEVAYLKSYVNMGQADIACASGCECVASAIDGMHADKTSQVYLHEFHVSQHDECVIRVTVASTTSGGPGHHKVKIAGVMISEESGSTGIKNFGAVQMALEGSAKGKSGTFEIREWASAQLDILGRSS